MNATVYELGMSLMACPITPDSGCYRPPSWPPPADWIISLDANGEPLSRWGDPIWDFSVWAGVSFKLPFGEGEHGLSSPPLGPQNQHLMRLLATWMLWGPRGVLTWTTLRGRFNLLRRIIALCDREGVVASDLMRFPKVLEQVPGIYIVKPAQKQILVELDRVLGARKLLGFGLIDKEGLVQLSKKFSEHEDEDGEQTAYIPPRIWTYQVLRLRECLEDFIEAKQQVENCFRFCVDAYVHNFGTLEAAFARRSVSRVLPFGVQKRRSGKRNGRLFLGPFEKTAQRFGIDHLFKKWIDPTKEAGIKSFTTYLTLVQLAGLAYIANFTLQRKKEVGALRKDCLIWESDDVMGHIAIIRGETTKTDPDSDARWPTSSSVKLAVDAMTSVAMMRVRCAAANSLVNCSEYDVENPYLIQTAYEPWSVPPDGWKPYSVRPAVQSYQSLVSRYPLLFNSDTVRITEDDLNKARMFTPNLDKGGAFSVGEFWPFGFHQLRRTGGVNMFASGLLSDSSIQMIMKHLTLLQTAYYGRNHTRLRFSEDVEGLTVAARYEVMAKQIENLVADRYVSPAGDLRKQEIVNLIGSKDLTTLIKAGKNGEISFRETRLGGCTKNGHCDYGGIESVARCAGGDGDKPCRDAVFDKKKQSSIQRQLTSAEERLRLLQAGSPRSRALAAEVQGLRNFLDVIHT